MPLSGLVKSKFIDQHNNLSIYAIDIKEMSQELRNKIDEHILRVCEGRNTYDTTINDVKLKIKNFLKNKLTEDSQQNNLNETYMGAVAEFFIHILLNDMGLEQECTFKNLEERSIKKGFDGYYSDNNKTWIVESKSGLSTSVGGNHKDKLSEAYRQLQHKITTCNENDNNPWENAFNHAKVVDARDSILKQLKKLSNQFENRQINNDIKDFNLIPCSTIFYFEDWEEDRDSIISKAKNFALRKSYSNMIVICINKLSMNLLINYLEEQNG